MAWSGRLAWHEPPALVLREVGDIRARIKQQNDRLIRLARGSSERLCRRTELPMHQLSDNSTALAAFVAHKTEIDTILTRLVVLGAEHFNYSRDETTWAHAGSLGSYLQRLREVSAAAFQEDQHAH